MNPAIQIRNVSKLFGNLRAVDDVSVDVEEKTLTILIGPNGSGKTTLINVLCGLLESTSGSVHVGGYDVRKETSIVKELIGVCPQDTAAYSFLTGRENVELFGNLQAVPKSRLEKNIRELFEKMSLTEDANRRLGKYSGGMKRRINLIIALVHDPEIAFLDEPTVAMDPQNRHAVWDFMKELERKGKTIILTTHYMEEAQELCGRVGIMDHGKLIALGSPEQLMDKFQAKDLEEVFIELTGRNIREEI